MRKLEIKEAALMRLALHDEIRRSEDSRYDHRLHGVLLVCSGLSCYAVAELLGQSPRTVHPLFCRQRHTRKPLFEASIESIITG